MRRQFICFKYAFAQWLPARDESIFKYLRVFFRKQTIKYTLYVILRLAKAVVELA